MFKQIFMENDTSIFGEINMSNLSHQFNCFKGIVRSYLKVAKKFTKQNFLLKVFIIVPFFSECKLHIVILVYKCPFCDRKSNFYGSLTFHKFERF